MQRKLNDKMDCIPVSPEGGIRAPDLRNIVLLDLCNRLEDLVHTCKSHRGHASACVPMVTATM